MDSGFSPLHVFGFSVGVSAESSLVMGFQVFPRDYSRMRHIKWYHIIPNSDANAKSQKNTYIKYIYNTSKTPIDPVLNLPKSSRPIMQPSLEQRVP